MSFDTPTMWKAIVALADISHSHASNNQRLLSKTYNDLKAIGLASPELPRSVQVHPTIEATTGKVISKIT